MLQGIIGQSNDFASKGLEAAIRNAADAVSLTQTAEGALDEVSSIYTECGNFPYRQLTVFILVKTVRHCKTKSVSYSLNWLELQRTVRLTL